jgi:16S rRNA (guanine1516-N2)-methyltransferase
LFELSKINERLVLHNQETQLFIDFASLELSYRRKHGGGRGQLIAKACGLKKYPLPLTILDATAGTANDSYILASLGCSVHLCEENPQIFALLQDAHQRALNSSDLELVKIAQNMQLYLGNNLDLIPQICRQYPIDVIYFDPMFPKSNKTALPKNAMQILRQIATENTIEHEAQALALAQQYAKKRIVVKRHKNSPFFANIKPSAEICGKTNRFDLYATNAPQIDSFDTTFS